MWPLKNKYPSEQGILKTEKSNVEATIVFCDAAGFMRVTEVVSPEDLIRDLNRYLTTVVEVTLENKGTIANFIGDAVFAYWLADDHPDHAALACQFAQSLRKRLATSSHSSCCKLITRTGIHTGPVAVISIDRGDRRDLTLIGDSVNLASRLSALCGEFKADAIITEAVLARSGPISGIESLGEVRVKGKELPVALFKI